MKQPKKKKRRRKEYWDKKYFVLDIDAYGLQIGVAVNMSEEEIPRAMKRKGAGERGLHDIAERIGQWDTDGAHGRMVSLRAGYLLLFRFEKLRFRKSMSIVAHEVHHVVTYILRDRRTPLVEDTEEVYAYLQEHVTLELLKKLYD